jgi:spore coat-associated protein N
MGLKTKLAMAVATSAAGAAMIAGGSFALFSASTSNTSNTFTAGTVKIADNTANGGVWSGAQYIGNLAPGDSENGTLTVQNTGTLDEWVQVNPANETGGLFGGSTPLTITTSDATVFKLAPGATQTIHYTYILPLAADNSYQAATGSVDFNVQAVQARNNTNAGLTGPNGWS